MKLGRGMKSTTDFLGKFEFKILILYDNSGGLIFFRWVGIAGGQDIDSCFLYWDWQRLFVADGYYLFAFLILFLFC